MVIAACKDGLSAACFKEHPEFARQAFSFRLLQAFIPPQLSSKLFTFLGLNRFRPGDPAPEWLSLPPWWIIFPGAVWPPGWLLGDPPPPGVWAPPIIPPERRWKWPTPPIFLIPIGIGPPRNPYPASSPPAIPWFLDEFSSIDLTIWEKILDGSATIAQSNGFARFFSEDPDYCTLRTGAQPGIPNKWVFAFRVKILSYTGTNCYLFIQIYTGSHVVKLRLNPPETVWHATGAGSDEISVTNYVNVWKTYKLYYEDGYTDLYEGSTLLSSNQHHQHDVSVPGRIYFSNNKTITSQVDYCSLFAT